MTRRDRCYFIGKRGKKLSEAHMANAWGLLCQTLVELGDRDMPKFDDVLAAIRKANVRARHAKHNPEWDKAEFLLQPPQKKLLTSSSADGKPCVRSIKVEYH